MTAQPAILVIGATGNVGRNVVAQLRGEGVAVRAMTRDPATASLPDGVEVVRGDLADEPSLRAALAGVRSVFLVWPLFTAELAPAVVSAIAEEAERLVYLSSNGVRDDVEKQSDPINQFHADVEREIQRTDLAWTFVRAGGFAANDLAWAEEIREGDVVRAPFAEAAGAMIHEADIAAVGVRALLDDGYAGTKPSLTGPEVLTNAERVALIGAAIGRPVRFDEQPAAQARQEMIAAGWPADVVDGILDAHADTIGTVEQTTSTVADILGRPARTYREWAEDHAADFR
ncbi:uncharacterized protein YbjT (DUF2867 family) [Actinoalloteichus hoggarensis]|uniref:NAD(P)H azoreductase n=1 Tax=Actinoalloteichus hoggarensis TaxID=1470176 RepID=A0A221W7F6_9PSEU|nr:NAD(P)H-binding protein [Actinoalloteichus hoggarensis]ASO21297.1 NAD(P)H azoreductase [Actinoalloteichus hoggarensis]MBB5921229.1 uncharacterized protein YbjT (DUF2867 family) [Actinoalloteichus hoggarensis]